MTKEQIITLINVLYENGNFNNCRFSLTINYDQIVKDYLLDSKMERTYNIFNKEGLESLLVLLNKYKKYIDSFNLTLIEDHGIDHKNLSYSIDWYSCTYSFYGDNEIIFVLDILSTYHVFGRDKFYNYFKNDFILKDGELNDKIQKITDLKKTIINNGYTLLNKLNELKNI